MSKWWAILSFGMILHTFASGQTGFTSLVGCLRPPDSTTIDLLNDYAWSIARNNPDSAEIYAREAIREANTLGGYPKGLINAHILLGIIHKDKGYFGLSVEHYLLAMELSESTGDHLRVSGCLNNLGSVAQEQGKFAEALDYFRRSLALEEQYGQDEGQRSIRLFNIGEAYQQLDSLDEATAYYYNSLLIEEKLDSKEGIFYARLGIGKVDLRTGNYAKAGEELHKALDLAETLENNPGICETNIALGDLALQQKSRDRAFSYYDTALQRAQNSGYKKLQTEALYGLYRTHLAMDRPDLALKKLEAYHALRDEINSAVVNTRIGELQARYDLKKKEQELELLRKEELLRKNEVKYERKLRNYLLFTIAFVLILILINFRRSRTGRGNQHA
ncbi:MAG: tetratricopeptide repeat protein [Bacteroidia bacterium]|nr:tetratricopeptide repeat protein [Bacteroidia bacterium]